MAFLRVSLPAYVLREAADFKENDFTHMVQLLQDKRFLEVLIRYTLPPVPCIDLTETTEVRVSCGKCTHMYATLTSLMSFQLILCACALQHVSFHRCASCQVRARRRWKKNVLVKDFFDGHANLFFTPSFW